MPAIVKTHYDGVAELIQLRACHNAEFPCSLSRGDRDARSKNLTTLGHLFSSEEFKIEVRSSACAPPRIRKPQPTLSPLLHPIFNVGASGPHTIASVGVPRCHTETPINIEEWGKTGWHPMVAAGSDCVRTHTSILDTPSREANRSPSGSDHS